MTLKLRSYDHDQDFERVGQFLVDHYQPGTNWRIWIRPRWEYMNFHPLIMELDRSKFGIAEMDRQIVGVVHFESDEGIVYMQVPPGFDQLKPTLIDYAEQTFGSVDKLTGKERLVIYINEADTVLRRLAVERGYVQDEAYSEVYCRYDLSEGVPSVHLPDGFRLQSLADENDLEKVHQVLWRGFNHSGPPPKQGIKGRRFMQQAPNFRHDLTMVVVAPNGDYVSYCGIWFEEQNRLTYVEPVATDPDYRRMGLGKAVVLEGLRRTIPLGSQTAWVLSDQEFYKTIGFVLSFREDEWVKFL